MVRGSQIESNREARLKAFWRLGFLQAWNRWTDASVNRRIFGAALTIGVLSAGVKIVAAVKEMAVAQAFGTSDALDAFLAASVLPTFAINIIAGSFNAALIPSFVKVREREGPQAAERLLTSCLRLSLALLCCVAVILACSSGLVLPLIGSRFGASKLELTRELYYWLLPTLMICAVSTAWSAVLNARQRFALAALTPVITPALTLAVLLQRGGMVVNIRAIAIATVCGLMVEAVILGWALRRTGFPLAPRWHGFSPELREVLRQYAPVAAGAVLMSGSLVVNQSMAAMLGPGSVAGLNYGTKLVSFILSIGSLALGTAVLPFFSRMVAAEDWSGVSHTLRTYMRLLIVAGLVVSAGLVISREPLVRFLFERGSFTPSDTHLVARISACFALQIPFYLAGQVGVRLLISMGKGREVMKICAVNLATNLLANAILMRGLGVAGIALATSVVYLVSCLQIFFVASAELKRRSKLSAL